MWPVCQQGHIYVAGTKFSLGTDNLLLPGPVLILTEPRPWQATVVKSILVATYQGWILISM